MNMCIREYLLRVEDVMLHRAKFGSTKIYERIEKDFHFLENFGFKATDRIYSYVTPNVVFERGEQSICIGFAHDDERVVAMYTPVDTGSVWDQILYESKTYHEVSDETKSKLIRPVDLLEKVKFKGNSYDNQYEDAIDYLKNLLEKGL